MKKVMTSLAICITLLFSAGTIIAGGDESGGISGQVTTKFMGKVKQLPAGLTGPWMIGEREVQVTKATIIIEKRKKIRIGSIVEVEGTVSGNTFHATKIEMKKILE